MRVFGGHFVGAYESIRAESRLSPCGLRRFCSPVHLHAVRMIASSAPAMALTMTLLTPILAGCRGVQPQHADKTLEDVIAENTAARGGAKAIESAHTLAIRLRIAERKFTVDGLYQASRDGRMRIDVFANGKRVYSEGYDGQRAWQLSEDAEHGVDSSPSGAAALRHGLELPITLRGLHEMGARGHQLRLLDRELVDGTNYYVVEVRFDDGFTTYLYVNPSTNLIDRMRDIRALHPDIDAKTRWIEQRYEDFREVDGRIFPFKSSQVDLRNQEVMQTTMVLEVTTNPRLTKATFAAP